MDWETTFVVYRIINSANVEEVFRTSDLPKAKYWISYIAEPGDVLCRTPKHPKHSGKGKQPEYFGHKEVSGKMSQAETDWKTFAESKQFTAPLPETPKS